MPRALIALMALFLPFTAAPAGEAEYRSAALALGPKGYWRFDETSGTTAVDTSAANHPGTYTAVTLAQPGAFGAASKAIYMDNGKYVMVPNHADFNSATGFTICGWVKMTSSIGGEQQIANKEYAYEFAVNSFNFQGAVETSDPAGWFWAGNKPAAFGFWQHFALTYGSGAGENMRIYVNGVLVTNQALAGTLVGSSYPLYFGTRGGGVGSNGLGGLLDEVSYYDRPLTGTEISNLFTSAGYTTYYRDADGDGYGANGNGVAAYEQPSGYLATSGDFDDSRATSYPGAPEIFDGFDNNGNGLVDEGLPGSRDYTFSGDGVQTTAFVAGSAHLRSAVVQPDGNIVVGGFATVGVANYDFAISRYLSNGALDPSFGTSGTTTTAIGAAHDQAYALARQSDGKFLLAGFYDSGTNADFAIARYTSNGTLDPMFDSNPSLAAAGTGSGKVTTVFNLGGDNYDRISGIAVQADGKIVVAGFAATASGRDVALARYNSNGSLDTSFDGDGKLTFPVGTFNDYGLALTLQADGKILVGGSAYVSGSNTASLFVARLLTANGAFDPTFGTSGKVTTAVQAHADGYSLAVQPDGKIILSGLSDATGNSGNGTTADMCLVRYLSDGTLDTTFDGDGKGIYTFGSAIDAANAVKVQADGKIVAVGTARVGSYDKMAILRVNADGSADTTFDGDGKITLAPGPQDDALYAMDFDANGNIVAVGLSDTAAGIPQFAAVRLLGLPRPGVWNLTAAQVGNGSGGMSVSGLLQAGSADSGASVTVEYGTSPAFGSSVSLGTLGVSSGSATFNTTLYPGGLTPGTTYYYRTVATNQFGTTTGATQTFVYAPGGLDFTFAGDGVQTNLGIGASQGRAVAMQNDGKIVVAGFTHNGTKNVPALVRYLSTGALDTSFGTGGVATVPMDGTDEQLYAVAIQSDGKIVAAGAAVRGGDFDMILTRWTATGQPDTSFDGDGVAITGYGANQDLWKAVSILPSGQILVGGYTQNGAAADYVLARYNTDGMLDANFDGDSGTANGRVVVSIAGADGAHSMAVQPDGKIILAGDSDANIALVRFTAAGLLDTSFGTGGKVTAGVGVGNATARGLALQPDGKIVAACEYLSAVGDSNGLLMRFNANGSNDNTFDGDGRRGYGTSVNDDFMGVTIQSDGRIVAVGRAGNTSGVLGDMFVLRANADGSPDTTFDGDGMMILAPGSQNDRLYGVASDASGNIVAAGLSDTSSGLAQFAVARVLAFPETTLIKNGSFESNESFGGGIVTGFHDWGWDVASTVTAENGITPYAGSRMLKFISSGPTMTPTSPWCDVPQYVDLSAYSKEIALGLVSATATARFNRVAGNASTDTRFDVIIEAHRGAVPGPFISQNDVQLLSDANPSTWEPITNTFPIPTDTTHLLVGVYAYENIVDNSSGTEFDGHYADDVQLTINVAPFAPTFISADTSGVNSATVTTTTAPTLTGLSIGTISLGFAPTPGTSLMLIKNTALGFINGQFSNLAQGQTVTLNYGGVNYNFVANYYGGTGNDLVLVWKDTKVWAWGYNSSGQIGDGSTTTTSPFGKIVPTEVASTGVLAGKTVFSVAGGSSYSLALCSDGTVVGWGANGFGQLGNNSLTSSNIPVAVNTSGVLTGKTVIAVAAGSQHSLALCSDGTVAAWGLNDFGQLGNNSTTNSSVPVAVTTGGVLLGKMVVAVTAGERFSLALCSDGTIAAWGYNHRGQLGNNTTNSSSVPVAVNTTGVLSGKTVVAISATVSSPSDVHCLAVCADGSVAAWGANSSGQLGNNSTTQSNVPVAVNSSGVLSGKSVVGVGAGGAHSVAICSDGTLAAWGANGIGQLGNTISTQSNVPVLINTGGVLSGKSVAGVRAGYSFSVAGCTDGTVASWGNNSFGQLGNNSTAASNVPASVFTASFPTGSRVGVPVAGESHTLALVASPPSPVVAALAVSNVSSTDATLNGTVNAVGGSATVTFEYGLTTGYGSTVTATPSPVTGSSATSVSAALTGLAPGTTYHYRLTATSAGGTTTGADQTFTTLDTGFWYVQMFEDHTNFPSVSTLTTADALIASGARIAQGTAAQADLYGTSSTNPAGRFPFDYPLPGYPGNHNDYAVKATARFVVTVPGDYTFAANTDDGVRIKIDGTTIIADDGLQAQADSPYVTVNLSAGTHRIEWVWFEHLGQDVGEVFAAPGVHTSFNSSFKLVGDPTLFAFASGAAEIAIEQPAATDLTSGAATRDFGSVDLGSTASLTFTARNTGTADLNDLGIAISGTNAADFTFTASPVAPVIPGGSTTFTVCFAPTVSGSKSATVQLASNDADEPSFVIALTGYARTPVETWRQTYFGSTSNTGSGANTNDADGDGVPNLTEFAFGTLPDSNASGPSTIEVVNGVITRHGSQTVQVEKTTGSFSYKALFGRRRDWETAGLTFTVQFSGDLSQWFSSSAIPTVIATDADIEAVTVPYPLFVGGKKAQFYRVVVGTTP
ncbi:MAG: choice-of-anchor D domain-containing protein [Verrucomicrobiaceae bacterium]|nr:choice-of-anchor D domain-containing protein [Verrucomicrobiaceae bacterium]